jgi:tetratricopeptide (TPR) repeat protein
MFGRKSKIRKAVERALAGVDGEQDLADLAPIEHLPEQLHIDAYLALANELYRDERYDAAAAVLAPALALGPEEVDLHRLAAATASQRADPAAAIAAQRRVVELAPRDVPALVALAELLIAAEQIDETIELLRPWRVAGDPEIETRLAEALFLRGENQEALAILDEVCALYDAQLRQLSAADWHTLKARADDARQLRDDVYAEAHGREATIELAAADRQLDGTAGVNYRLLGASLAARASRMADVLELEEPDATERRGNQLLAGAPGDARGLVLVGSAQLRRGDLDAARKTFERACEADGRCFAAFIGLGAAIDHAKHRLHRRAAALGPPPHSSVELEAIVADLAALTDAERRVVWASARPLAALLPAVAAAGATMRILPIDVRATDIGLFAESTGARAEDHRTYDAISGLATHGGAIAKIEELLDVVTDGGWTFAHELAHLAFFHMSEEQTAPVLEIYERALDVGYANTEYALSNPDEFFACSYTDYLRQRHGLPGEPLDDDAGIVRALMTYFNSLGEDVRP